MNHFLEFSSSPRSVSTVDRGWLSKRIANLADQTLAFCGGRPLDTDESSQYLIGHSLPLTVLAIRTRAGVEMELHTLFDWKTESPWSVERFAPVMSDFLNPGVSYGRAFDEPKLAPRDGV
jgi:hypothetical protein